ncbi:outer membrane biogenesis protein BamB [Gimesia chilikensis]|uniref:Outer membrane biogenesis protein BamB n=1 Tax=Gimesia chilikensis TaxID=2605989 RepID=A0A517WJT4_9PLAN|nr:PQQ-binding-like beta-propeller repeat protein [Gimesia chilikensis]QDU05499.1 outer membrane biogenesis protein BamB [Gimesia chilikensis]
MQFSHYCIANSICFLVLSPIACTAQINAPGTQQSTVSSEEVPERETDWPRFRGPEGNGHSRSTGLPAKWSDSNTRSMNVVWKTKLPGGGSSSAVVWGDQVYLTSYTGYLVPGEPTGNLADLTRHLLCLDRESGKILWNREVPARQPEEESIRDHGFAANTVAADENGVCVFFGKSGVFAYTHDGQQQWQHDVGSRTHGWGTGASPILHDDLVIVNASVECESLIALDRRTGEERWRAGGLIESWNTPIVVKTLAGKEELVVAVHGKVLGFSPTSGEQLWSCDSKITWYMVPSIVADAGIVYVLGGRSGVAGLAVRTGGRGDVTTSHRLWTSNKGSNVTSPVFLDGHLYWMHENIGIAYCANATSGDLVYEKRMNRAGQVYASTLLANDRIYYLTRTGRTFVVAAKPEFELLATNDLEDGGQFNASPSVSGNRLLIRSDRYLYCLGE